MILVDGHCDTIKKALDENINLDDSSLSFNIKDAWENKPILQMTAAFVNPSYEHPFQRACDIISYFEKQKEKYQDKIIQITSCEEIDNLINSKDKIGLMLTIENGRAVENDLNNVDYFYDKGVRIMSITWNEDNLLGCGNKTTLDNGLTKLGEQYIKKLNQKKIITDISHCSERTFWDTVKITDKPIVATHSCAYSICNHTRNLKDEQIKEIAKINGIIGICFCSAFLAEDEIASTEQVVQHIAYIANLVGIDYVGLGSDFDGLYENEKVTNLKRIQDISNLVCELQNYGFNKEEIEKIMGNNWIRVLKEQLN